MKNNSLNGFNDGSHRSSGVGDKQTNICTMTEVLSLILKEGELAAKNQIHGSAHIKYWQGREDICKEINEVLQKHYKQQLKIDESKVIKVKPVVIKEGESKPKKYTKQFKNWVEELLTEEGQNIAKEGLTHLENLYEKCTGLLPIKNKL